MLPQGLLFSSDQQVAELILALLPEFGIEVEHRPDVFSAIEKLTSRPYDLLVVDWKDPLEASFLLKTARELSMAKATPAIAVVDQKDSSAALNLGANGVLVRPFSYEQARSTFEACFTGRSSKPHPVQAASRQVPPPTKRVFAAAPPSSKPARVFIGPAAPENSVKPMTASLPTFAGYAQTPGAKSSNKVIKAVPVILAVIGLGLAGSQFRQIEARLSAVQWLSPFRSTTTAALANQDAPGLEQPPIAFENPRLGTASDYSAEMADTRPPSSARSRGAVKNPAPTAAADEASYTTALRLMEPQARLVRPDVPGSLMVSLQAMTGRPAETKLSQQQASRWSLEPILLPEENARQLLLRQIQPKYPEFAVAAGLEGVVTLHAFIDKQGTIRDLKLIRGSLLLGRSAFDAVKQWRYKPYRINGEAVEMQTFITVSFVRSSHAALAQKLP